MNCPLCGEIIEDPELELCPSCHRAFNDEFGYESISPDIKVFNTEEI